jgi:hypothetical protein
MTLRDVLIPERSAAHAGLHGLAVLALTRFLPLVWAAGLGASLLAAFIELNDRRFQLRRLTLDNLVDFVERNAAWVAVTLWLPGALLPGAAFVLSAAAWYGFVWYMRVQKKVE